MRELIGELFVLTDWLLASTDEEPLGADVAVRDLASEGAGRG